MHYHLDLKENKQGKHLIHSDYCVNSCPSYKKDNLRDIGDYKDRDEALIESKKKFPKWESQIIFCEKELDLQKKESELREKELELESKKEIKNLAEGCLTGLVGLIIIPLVVVSCIGYSYNSSGKDKKSSSKQSQTTTKKTSSKSNSYGISRAHQKEISSVLYKARLEHLWASEISLWIKNSHGWGKAELLSVGNTLCNSAPARGYVITFWYSLEPRGEITKVRCF